MSAGQEPAQDPARAALERRYLRLLRCYPPSHRQAHREEMLGVLLAAARPGQRAPGLTQAVNLAACGLAIRARRILLAGPWQDALAVVSLIAPVLMLISSVLDLAQTVRETVAADQQYPPAAPFWQLDNLPQLAGPTAVLIAWLAVVILALAGRRRTAAAIACVPLALDLATMLTGVLQQSGGLPGGLPELLWMAGLGPVIPASLAACSLAFSPGPRRGLAIAGWRRTCLLLAGLAGVYGAALVARLVSPFASVTSPAFRLLDVLVLVVAVALLGLPGTARGRVGALLASGLVLDLAGTPSGIIRPAYTALLGWLYQDAGDLKASARWRDLTLGLAHRSTDAQLVSYALTNKAMMAVDLGDGSAVVDFAQAALADESQLCPKVRILALQHQAHGHAMLADRRQADRLLDTAEMLTGLVDDEYPWGNACRRTPSYVDVQRATCYGRTGRREDTADAAALWDEIMSGMPGSLRRDNAVFSTRQAAALAAVPDPERVTAIAADAVGLVQVTGSARLRKELMALPRQAAAWRNTPHGRQLRAIVGSVA